MGGAAGTYVHDGGSEAGVGDSTMYSVVVLRRYFTREAEGQEG